MFSNITDTLKATSYITIIISLQKKQIMYSRGIQNSQAIRENNCVCINPETVVSNSTSEAITAF